MGTIALGKDNKPAVFFRYFSWEITFPEDHLSQKTLSKVNGGLAASRPEPERKRKDSH